MMCIEQAASGQSLIQMLERESKIHIHPFKPTRSKTVRLQTVSPLFEAGRVHFIEGDWSAEFCKELCAFPLVPHDDKTDAVVWGLTYYNFNLIGVANSYSEAFGRGGRQAGREEVMDGFTELKAGHNKNKWSRRSLFDRGEVGDVYRLGQRSSTSRSDDLKYD